MSDLNLQALEYHEFPKPGKISIHLTKATNTQRDLALAYSPGVAAPVRAIAKDPQAAYRYTSKGNLVAVISNGTAVLGLGNVGALAGKPVMEGKGVLFKRFADVDVFDIEVDTSDINEFVKTVTYIAPTFGGINLEDIKAPECFEIEEQLIKKLNIPVFHDDQHGTAITVAAALLNALSLQQKKLENISMVCVGAGAAGIASMKLLVKLGMKKEQITMVDTNGVVHTERNDLNKYKLDFAQKTSKRTLMDAIKDADVFIGVSGANLLTDEMVKQMAPKPVIFALANPDPEILPHKAKAIRNDLIIATGRSDFSNQVNNVLCFPYIFRGALDVRASKITEEMMIAAVHAIKDLARTEVPEVVNEAYAVEHSFVFGPDYILPKPLDPRLIDVVAPAVARAAEKSNVAGLLLPDYYTDTV